MEMSPEEVFESMGIHLTDEQKEAVAQAVAGTAGDKPPKKKYKGFQTAWVASFQDGAIQFKTPKKGFLDSTAGKALIVGVVAAGIVVLVAGIYYLLKTSGVLEPLGALPPADMNPAID